MTEKAKRWLAILLFAASLVSSQVACSKSGCTSQYGGCEATATFIQRNSDPAYRNATPVPAPTVVK